MKPFYVTTPIYYVNDRPHIGTAYSTIAADVLARYARLRGRPTRFLTGVDEHGLKLARTAEKEGMTPQAFVDQMAPAFKDAWKELSCTNDDFIRTSDPRHKEQAQALWKTIQDKGDIYLGDYEDWYCVGCEAYYTEKDLLEGKICPQHKKPVERIKEQSYFFKLSAYTERLLAFYEAHPNFVRPEGRFNEVKSFVREGLRDLSISRTSFRWGIPVPNDSEHVMYVWFDALTNYISTLGGPDTNIGPRAGAGLYDKFWAPNADVIHIVGKDILRFHAVFWPAFLLSAGIEPPAQIWAHGWLTINGEKMSKTLGNAIAPAPLAEAFGVDVLRYYLMRDMAFGQDGDFNHRNLLARYNGELGNGLGNLLNRVVASIVQKSFDGVIPGPRPELMNDDDRALIASAEQAATEARGHLDDIAPQRALDAIWTLVAAANKYVDRCEPWALVKRNETERLAHVVYMTLEAVRWIGVMIAPFLPGKADELRTQLGLSALLPVEGLDAWPSAWGGLLAGTRTKPGAALFPRFDKAQEDSMLERLGVPLEKPPAAAKPSKSTEKKVSTPETEKPASAEVTAPAAEAAATSAIEFEDFAKVDLRVGLVLTAERVPKSDKLLKLSVEVGEALPRQIIAGIGLHYAPEAMVSKRIVIVANLKPRKLMGLLSQGMVLAASDANGLKIVTPDGDIAPGGQVK